MPNAATRSSFWAAGQPTSRCAPELAQGAWLRRGPRRLSRAQSCFPAKENPSGVGFGRRRPPANQQGPGCQRQPSPALPEVQRRPRCENGLHCFPEQWRGAADVAPRGAFPVPLQTAVPRTSVGAVGEPGPRCCAAHLGSGGIDGAWAKKAFACPVLLPQEGEHFGGGFQAPETPSKAAGPRAPGAAPPRYAH